MNPYRNFFSFRIALAIMLLVCGHAHAADSDALAISANIQARHIPSDSVSILDPIYTSATSNQVMGYTRCGDSAIWTGHYLAAEPFDIRSRSRPTR